MPSETYLHFVDHIRAVSTAKSIEQLLDWDQETYMPKRAAQDRANQLAWLAGVAHERFTDPTLGEALGKLEREGDPDPVVSTNVRETRREYDRAVKLPKSLVEEIARTSALAKTAWQKARKESDFVQFAPHLERLLDLKRQVAQHVGWTTGPYDALMDEFEPGARSADIQTVFDGVKAELVPLVAAIKSARRKPDESVLKRHCPQSAQAAFNARVAEGMGFDFDAGRIDTSVHPFCSGPTPNDVRLTNRFDEHFLPMSLFGIMHEAGHGLYEQGLDASHTGTPMAQAVSLGIHESQSRMWENFVGRSRPFWEHFFPVLQSQFPSLAHVSLDAWHFAINTVKPSFIRVEADEVTYGLHIMLRFDLERRLIEGTLAVRDVPAAWNAGMQALLGIVPPNDAQGCLQDIHWSMGIFGYFPTYALGNLYAAQFFDTARKAMPDLDDQIRAGRLRPLREWLRENIHRHGRRYRAHELVQVVTGQALSSQPFAVYLKSKFGRLYGI